MNPMSTAERQDFADKTRAAMHKVGIDPSSNMVKNLIVNAIKIENFHRLFDVDFPEIGESPKAIQKISLEDRKIFEKAVELAMVGFNRRFSCK